MKKILFVLRKPPHSGAYWQETLDVVMTAAAFDQDVSLLLLDDAVFQLKSGQNPEGFGLKATIGMIKALPLYGINPIYVETESLIARGLSQADLSETVIAIPIADLGRWQRSFDLIL
jgi:tRNA 2-thiouridine synthesizing protein C